MSKMSGPLETWKRKKNKKEYFSVLCICCGKKGTSTSKESKLCDRCFFALGGSRCGKV